MEIIIALYIIGSLISVGLTQGMKISTKDEEITSGIFFVMFIFSWFGIGVFIGYAMSEILNPEETIITKEKP